MFANSSLQFWKLIKSTWTSLITFNILSFVRAAYNSAPERANSVNIELYTTHFIYEKFADSLTANAAKISRTATNFSFSPGQPIYFTTD